MNAIVECGFNLAAEDCTEYPDDEDTPNTLSLIMLYAYASEVPASTIYPIFKNLVVQYCQHPEPHYRKAGLRVLGQVCDNDALLDNIKDDIDELVPFITSGLVDQSEITREAAATVVGFFAEYVVPEFLEMADQVMPSIFQMLENYASRATTSEDHALNAQKALYAMSQFVCQMDDSEVKPYLEKGLKIIDIYLNGQG